MLGVLVPAEDELEARRHPGLARAEEEQGDERPTPRRERADRDQRVHRRGSVLQVEPRGAVERPAAPEHDRSRQQQREPLPVVELQRLDHRQQQHRQREGRGDDQPPPQRSDRVDLGLLLGPDSRQRKRCAIARGPDRGHELLGRNQCGVEADRGVLGRVVDGRLDALELVQALLDPGRARRAGHALDRKLDALEARRAHSTTAGGGPSAGALRHAAS